MAACWRLLLNATIASLLACAALAKAPRKTLVYYVDFEHTNVTYWNPGYYRSVNVTARRISRQDPIHYLQAHGEILVALGNNVMVDFYLFEFLSNEYRRSFVESHNRLCDYFDNKKFLAHLDHLEIDKRCPFPKGIYHFANMSFPDLPLLKTFPFSKGRLFVNASMCQTSERHIEAYVDVAIRQRWL